ncbi:hypothetical protein ABIE45_006416 [Methylobacterium sp. OAE515]
MKSDEEGGRKSSPGAGCLDGRTHGRRFVAAKAVYDDNALEASSGTSALST